MPFLPPLAQFLHSLADDGLVTAFGGLVVAPRFGQVFLIHPRPGMVVGVLVAFTVPEFLGTAVVGVAQVRRHGQRSAVAHVVAASVMARWRRSTSEPLPGR